MRKARGFVVVAALASALVAGVAASAAGTDRPRVRMLDPTPLTLQGLDFARAEQVRLTVTLGKRIEVRKLRAGSTGSFKAMFPELRYGRCGPSLAVEAVGSRGHRVSWKIVPLECPTRTDS